MTGNAAKPVPKFVAALARELTYAWCDIYEVMSQRTTNIVRFRCETFSISPMDVPTRQSYTMAVVRPEERSAAGETTGVARTAGAPISPIFAGFLFTCGPD
jgi:hypothetical protein